MVATDARVRLVLVHGWAPPTPGGTSYVVERVLRDLGDVDLDVWTRATQRRAVGRRTFVLPGRYRYFPKLRSLPRAAAPLAWPSTALNAALAVASGVVIGIAARRDGATWILSVADEGFSQIAGAVAARVARVAHIIWVFDLWEENAYGVTDQRVARALEHRLWRAAAAILVHAEELAAHYRHKHDVDPHVLRTPIEEFPVGECDRGEVDGDAWEVVIAGSIYWAQAEALQRVARAVRALPGTSLTVIGDPDVQSVHIDADQYEPAVSPDVLRERLASASLLVLGLSFDAPFPEVVRTATPARLPEYLATGVPLLVHAPGDSHVAQYVRRHDLGTVVDIPGIAAVTNAIESGRNNEKAALLRAKRAQEFVSAAHGLTTVRASFLRILWSVAGRGRN